jgi:hypothetical protein
MVNANKPNNPKREHHVLPELYLRGFVIKGDKPFIWTYKRGESYNPGTGKITNNPYKISVKAKRVRDFYAYPKKDGRKDYDTYENILESLEKPANPIFKKIRAFTPIGAEEKRTFALYIVQMLRRVPAYRKNMKELLVKTAPNYVPRNPPKEIVENLSLEEIRQIAQEIAQEDGVEIQSQLRSFTTAKDSILIDKIFGMRWQFFIAPSGHPFLTGDNPVHFPEKLGLKHIKAELSFPISSKVTLVASWQMGRDENFVKATPEIVRKINRRIASNASHEIYFCESLEWASKLLNRSEHEYHPIY